MSARFINPLQVLNVKGVVSPVRPDEVAPLRLTAVGGVATVAFSPSDVIELQTRLNGGAWQPWDYSAISLQDGEYLEIRGDNTAMTGFYELGSFAMTGQIAASGSVMSLIYGGDLNAANNLIIPGQVNLQNLFYNCTSLVSAPELPATTLTKNCYNQLFYGCANLITAPDLPATQLEENCYRYLFGECASLISAPNLPATQLKIHCYDGMFLGCDSLTAAPELIATELVDYCYTQMFQDCDNLSSITVHFTDWGSNNDTMSWLYYCSPTGTFRCPAALDQSQRDDSHIPAGWTIETF